jgi:putative Mg2+ transporter-C (MgtC) family protein
MFVKDTARFDPIRVIEAVTAGVAFLAAGVVIFTRGQIQGLTTGAGMWLAGAIGAACGLGLWQIALFATLIALVVLAVLYAFENKMDLNQGEDFTRGEMDETGRRGAKAKGDKRQETKPARKP